MDDIKKRKKTERHTKESFISVAEKVHGKGHYIYDYVNYTNNKTPVDIVCLKHGHFMQRPDNHLKGSGCPVCRYEVCHQKTLHQRFLDYIDKANKKHGEKFQYVEGTFKGWEYDIDVVCPYHGRFTINAITHIASKYGCPKCAKDHVSLEPRIKKTTEEWIAEAKEVHKGKYSYEKSEYKGKDKPITITCPIHGDFEQISKNHLRGFGCPKCSETYQYSEEEWIEKAKNSHPEKELFFDKAHYKNNKTKVEIGCPKHGYYWILPNDFIKGEGCPKCSVEESAVSRTLSRDEIINKFKEVHGDRYLYDESLVYKNISTKVCIKCNKHGYFMMTPTNHISGEGCPECAPKSKMEERLSDFLKESGIRYEPHYSPEWLGRQHLDFYLPDYNIGIECQGIQHFRPNRFHKSLDPDEEFKKVTNLDNNKMKLCEENNLPLLYYTNVGLEEYPYPIIENEKELLMKIKSYGKNS